MEDIVTHPVSSVQYSANVELNFQDLQDTKLKRSKSSFKKMNL